MANVFLLIITRYNVLLDLNKPTRPVKSTQTKASKRNVTYEKGNEPERKIRYVGNLRVQSHKVPKRPCLETVITYKVAKWTVRGHVRHYKNGKSVYIKPGTRFRKALADSDKVTATTIRFKKRKDKAEHGTEQ